MSQRICRNTSDRVFGVAHLPVKQTLLEESIMKGFTLKKTAYGKAGEIDCSSHWSPYNMRGYEGYVIQNGTGHHMKRWELWVKATKETTPAGLKEIKDWEASPKY